MERSATYLHISLDLDNVKELCCYSQVGVNVVVVHLEVVIVDIWQLLEEEGEFDACFPVSASVLDLNGSH
jgi:hypothetical protein